MSNPTKRHAALLAQLDPDTVARLRQAYVVHCWAGPPDSQEWDAVAPLIEVVIIRSPQRLTRRMIEACPRLRSIIRAGSGTDNIDLAAAAERSIKVHTTPLAAQAVAELAIGLMLAVARNLPLCHAAIAAGDWPKSSWLGVELGGRRLGVLGYGKIGRQTARLGKALGMIVHASNGRRVPADAEVPILGLHDLLRRSEVLCLCCPLSAETRSLIGAAELAMLPHDAIVINVARGEVLDTEALLDALDAGHLRGAGLDTVAAEPDIPQRLRRHPRVVLTPHIGAQTVETHQRIGRAVETLVHRDLFDGSHTAAPTVERST